MATISALNIMLSMATGPLATDVTKAGGLVKGFDDKVRKSGSGFDVLNSRGITALKGIASNALVAAGGVLTAAAAVDKMVKTFDKLDKLAKASDKLGFSPQTMQAFTLAADLAGVPVESLTTNVLKMGKMLGEASEGGAKPAAEMLTRLGLSAKDLVDLPLNQAFAQIIDRISGLDSAAERARATMEIFGKAGVDLLPMLADTSKGIDEAQQFLADYNLELTRGDLAKIEGANDAWTRLTTILDGAWNKLAVQIAPSIQSIIELVIDLLKPTGDVSFAWEEIGGWIESAAALGADLISILVGGFRMFNSTQQMTWVGIELGIRKAIAAAKEFAGIAADPGDQKRIDNLDKEYKRLQQSVMRGAEELGAGLTGQAGEDFKKRLKEIKDAANEREDTGESEFNKLGDNIDDAFAKALVKLHPGALQMGSSASVSAILAIRREEAKKDNEKVWKDQLKTLKEIKNLIAAPPAVVRI